MLTSSTYHTKIVRPRPGYSPLWLTGCPAAFIVLLLAGCGGGDAPVGSSLAMTPSKDRDPAELAGTFEGNYISTVSSNLGETRATLTFVVTGNTFTGTWQTDTGASGPMSGTISKSTYEGVGVRDDESVCAGRFKISGLWGPTSTSFKFNGNDCRGKIRGRGHAARVR